MKRILRYLPRRAVFHRYPVVGRFAEFARSRAYLWSLRSMHVRPAIYVGSIVAMWPLVGFQVALALIAALVLRANFMIAGGLQFLSNPLTAAPLYYLTYRTGKHLLERIGYRAAPGEDIPEEIAAEALPLELDEISGFRATVLALFIGGTLCGIALAVLLDLLYLCTRRMAEREA